MKYIKMGKKISAFMERNGKKIMKKNKCEQKRRFALALAFMLAVVNTNLSSGVVLAEEVETETETEHHYNDNGFCTDEGCTDIYQPAQYEQEGDYYAIGNAGQLYWFANFVNVSPDNALANARLTNDIVVNEGVMTADTEGAREWIPIGKYSGLFDGQMHSISGLYVNETSEDEGVNVYAGLFGELKLMPGTSSSEDFDCIVKNLCVKDSYYHAAGLAYVESGAIGGHGGYYWNCCALNNTFELEYTGDEPSESNVPRAGGMVGNLLYGEMRNCFAANNNFEITFPDPTAYPQAGLMVGHVEEEVRQNSVDNCVLAPMAGEKRWITPVTIEQCKMGVAAWILNQGANQPKEDSEQNTIETLAWRQNLGEDDFPVLGGTHGIVHAKGDINVRYTNEHVMIDVPGIEPTCTESGLTGGRKCSGCSYVETLQSEISKKGHSFTNYESSGEVSCEKDTTMTAECDNGCGMTDTKVEPAQGHQPNGKYRKTDFVHYQTCLVCQKRVQEEDHKFENYKNSDFIYHVSTCFCGMERKEGHTWDQGQITKPATETETGTRKYTCTTEGCGAERTETIPELSEGNDPENPEYPGNEDPMHTHSFKTNIVKATTKKAGSIYEKCEKCGVERNSRTIPYIKTVKLSKSSCTYNGKTQKLSVTVKDSQGKALKNGTDYTVSVPKSIKNVGSYTVTVTFKGNYEGTAAQTFEIIPQTTGIKKILSQSKGFTITWKKQTEQITGYEIQYAADSKFKKNVKIASGGKSKNTSKKISGLKAKKKYYVRIRTYKTVKGKKYCSSWSKAKTVTTVK